MTDPAAPSSARRLLWGLVIVLAVWGVYLAIGATGVFTDAGLLDPRRSAIVLICSASFLGFWLWILSRRRPASSEITPRNRASRLSLIAVVLAYGLWGGAWWAWHAGNPAQLTFVCGWTSLGLFAIAAVSALIGLSDPLRESGKLWGLVTLLLLFMAMLAFGLQVRSFAQSQRGTAPQLPVPASAAGEASRD